MLTHRGHHIASSRLLATIFNISVPNVPCSDPSVAPLKAQLTPTMIDLARRMLERLKFPDEFDRWTSDKRDDFKHTYRYDVADVLLCCCEVANWQPVSRCDVCCTTA